jgi:hypothetical protein|tara:strand:+ start:1559 stop:2182 length:624 start_codon:yes stop_codon:yes gene_type:complete
MPFRCIPSVLLASAVLSLAGCAGPPTNSIRTLEGGDGGTLPRHLGEPPLALDRFHAPPGLAGLDSDGEISSDRSGWRQWLFGDPDTRLTVTVYGLPAGWQDLDEERVVSGHYGQLRQQRVNRVYNSDNQSIRFTSERLFDLEGRLTASARYLVNQPGRQPLREVLLLTVDGDYFVRIESGSRERKTTELLQMSKRALAEFRAFQASH